MVWDSCFENEVHFGCGVVVIGLFCVSVGDQVTYARVTVLRNLLEHDLLLRITGGPSKTQSFE